jgi:hypothetical protein
MSKRAKGMMVVLKNVRDRQRSDISQVNILMDEIRKITGQNMVI